MNAKLLLQQGAIAAVFVAAWVLGDATHLFNPDVIPPIGDVATAFATIWARPEFLPALLGTLGDALAGVAIAALCGIPLGMLIGMFPAVEISTRTLVDFGRSFPVIALMPILVLIIGSTHAMKITIVAIACFFPILLQTIYGARRLEPTIVDTVRAYRIPFMLKFFRVILPAALPFIATGIRIAVSVSVLVAVGVEVVINITGFGVETNLARINNQVAAAFAYVICAGILGLAMTGAWELVEARLLRWHRRAAAA